MSHYFTTTVAFMKNNLWLLESFAIVLCSLILKLYESRLFHRLTERLKRTDRFWDDALVQAIHRPLGLLIWVLGVTFAADVVGHAAQDFILFKAVGPIRKAATLILVVWAILRFVRKAEASYIKMYDGKDEVDKTTINAVSQLLVVSVFITSGLVGMRLFDIDITAIIAFGGIFGAGVAFAAKDLLANFFGGMMIYLDRPFSVGDWVRSPEREIEGTVENIGWRLTRIRTFDKRPLYVPNGTFLTVSVENPSRMKNRRIKTNIGVRYEDATKVGNIVEDVKKMLREHPEIDTKQTLIVNLVEFAEFSLNFMVYTFTKTTNWVHFQEIQQDVFLKIIDIITKNGAKCAIPSRSVYFPEVSPTLSKES